MSLTPTSGRYDSPPCEDVDEETVECFTCYDTGQTRTEGGLIMPCFDCELGDANLYHDRTTIDTPLGGTHD